MRLLFYFLIAVYFIFPNLSFAGGDGELCSSNGYTITTINGVFIDDVGARKNKDALEYFFEKTYNGEPLIIDYLVNQTHSILDITDTAIQKTFEGFTRQTPDFIKIQSDASAQVKTQKLLLVAHSQGNFYANDLYDTVTKNGDLATKSVGVYSVGTPANQVGGEGKYLTSSTDKIIAKLAENLLIGRIMTPNTTINYQLTDDSGLGHSFSGVYLQYRPTEIIRDIKWSLDKLSVDPARSENTICIMSPKALSTLQKVVAAPLYAVDTAIAIGTVAAATTKNAVVGTYHIALNTVIWTYNTSVKVVKWTYHTTVAVAVWGYDTALAIGKFVGNTAVAGVSTVYETVAGVLTSKPVAGNNNTASVILATQTAQNMISVNKQATTVTNLVTQPTTAQVTTSQKPQTVFVFGSTVAPAEAPRSIFAGSYSPGFGGGAPKVAPQVATEVKEEAVVATPAVVLEAASTKATAEAVAFSPSSVTLISPSNTTVASTTVIFHGTYTNNSTFDTIVFELKNISTSTATSSISHIIATTTGVDLTYDKEIALSEDGDWQYRARLDDSINATSTAWSSLAFFNLTISTTTAVATTTATSTPAIEVTATSTPVTAIGYTIVAEQPDHSSLDATPSYVQGVATEQNVVLSQDVTFTGANKGDNGRVVVWYYFGYGQDCSTMNMIGLTAGYNSGASFVPVSAVPNWDGSCVFRLNGGADDSVTLPAGTYALYMVSSGGHSPPYVYGKAGEKSNAVYCRGNEFFGNSCTHPIGRSPNFSDNLSDFAYIITSDTYIPPQIPDGVSAVPATMSPIVAEQTDHSTPDATIIDENSGYSAIQWNIALPHPVTFTGANKGDKGRVVAWYSFSPGQDCSTVGPVSLTAGYNSGVSLYSISKTPGMDGSCVFHIDDANGSVTLPAIEYALRVGGYNGGAPTPIGKPGGNSNAVFCAGNDFSAKSCGKVRAYSENLSDFAYVVTEDSYGTPTPAPSLPIAPPVVVPDVDVTPPAIISYTFNGVSGNIEADFATTTPTVDIVLTASENVDWVSIIIEDQSNPSNDKIFHSSASCVDGTATCAKSWDGVLSGGARAPDGVYRIKVHMKDTANNDYNDFISPYFITIKTATSTP